MTPLAMEMLIWWHVHTPTAKFPAIEYPSQQELVKLFMDDCVIWRVAPDQYTLTPLGEEWLMRALGTPISSEPLLHNPVGALTPTGCYPRGCRGGGSEANPEALIADLREYADYRATPDVISRLLWQAADKLEAVIKEQMTMQDGA